MYGTQYTQTPLGSPEKLRRTSGANSWHTQSPVCLKPISPAHVHGSLSKDWNSSAGVDRREGSPHLALPAPINHSEGKIRREWLGVFHLMEGSE